MTWIVILVFLIIPGLFIAIVTMHDAIGRRKLIEHGVVVEGHVADHYVLRSTEGQCLYYLKYRYDYHGTTYSKEKEVSEDTYRRTLKNADSVSVLCLPEDPTYAVIPLKRDRWRRETRSERTYARWEQSHPRYCTACGAANKPRAKLCRTCGQLFPASTQDTTLSSPVPAEALVPSALLAGRYRIIGIVGKGGFGAVYKAEDMQQRGLFVAIKEINLSSLSSQEMIEATDTFNREVRLLSELQHPNLPRIYDHFADSEHWYLAMDFIGGETLEEYLDSTKGGHLPVKEVLAIGIQLSTVLAYLHAQHPPIIFRDVKPANIMRTPKGHLYLIDFGIARRFTRGQRQDTMPLGSPGYAAPEQYGKAQTTVQSDIYSLGATLQTLLTGKNPVELASGDGSLYPQGRVFPAALDQLLKRMLDLDASKRPMSMDAVKRTLHRIQSER